MAIFRSFLSICDHLFARTKKTFQAVVLVRQLQTVNKKFILRILYDLWDDTSQKVTKITEAWNMSAANNSLAMLTVIL